ncbi:MAG: copper chaperone PCu(A)C [Acidimicrobiia bacterium]|nr:copper chaperone PCu(A)C [Acidimicrobiia bacterium]
MKRTIGAMVIVAATTLAGCGSGGASIDDVWARPSPPTAENAAFYFIADVEDGDTLIAADSSACGRTELHISQMQDGLMTMRPADTGQLTATDGTLILEPGGLHVMCMQLVEPLVEGEEVDLTVTFEQAGDIKLKVSVENR